MAAHLSDRQQHDLYVIHGVSNSIISFPLLGIKQCWITCIMQDTRRPLSSYVKKCLTWYVVVLSCRIRLERTSKADFTPDPTATSSGLLVKKWTSVIRMQKKVCNCLLYTPGSPYTAKL